MQLIIKNSINTKNLIKILDQVLLIFQKCKDINSYNLISLITQVMDGLTLLTLHSTVRQLQSTVSTIGVTVCIGMKL